MKRGYQRPSIADFAGVMLIAEHLREEMASSIAGRAWLALKCVLHVQQEHEARCR